MIFNTDGSCYNHLEASHQGTWDPRDEEHEGRWELEGVDDLDGPEPRYQVGAILQALRAMPAGEPDELDARHRRVPPVDVQNIPHALAMQRAERAAAEAVRAAHQDAAERQARQAREVAMEAEILERHAGNVVGM